ncbi:MAG: hypothetical protein LBE36_13520 [Flavobacteriaceae bacterium]|nr:hypothetical protein [Flavobacteriaceae bacterium]
MTNTQSLIIGVDFDGTCVTHEFPKIGKEIGAVPVLKRLVENGHRIILYTMRSDSENVETDDYNIHNKAGKYLTDAVNWFKENDIPLFGINENPEQKSWTTSPKPYCHIYIDDAALGCPIKSNEMISSRPFVDWFDVEKILEIRGIIK